MENVRSKRRPIQKQDDVNVAIDKMKHQWKYNPIRRTWWRYLIVFAVVFGILSYFGPTWSAAGPSGVANTIISMAIQLSIAAFTAILFI